MVFSMNLIAKSFQQDIWRPYYAALLCSCNDQYELKVYVQLHRGLVCVFIILMSYMVMDVKQSPVACRKGGGEVRKQWPWASTLSLYTGGHPIQNVVLNLTMGGRHPINKFHRRWSQTSTSLCTPPAATGVKWPLMYVTHHLCDATTGVK